MACILCVLLSLTLFAPRQTELHLYQIRGEFMRAARVLSSRPDRAIIALAELCEERKDEELVSAPTLPPRPPAVPPQTPYTVGSHSMRPKGAAERLSPPSQFFDPNTRPEVQLKEPVKQAPPTPPEHMAPKRSKWTSPPPPDSTPAARTLFESQLDKGIELATSSTEAREDQTSSWVSEAGSEVFTDEDRSDAAESDDIISVKSYTEGAALNQGGVTRRPSWHIPDGGRIPQSQGGVNGGIPVSSSATFSSNSTTGSPTSSFRGGQRFPREKTDPIPHSAAFRSIPEFVPTGRIASDFPSSRRPLSGPPRAFKTGSPVWTSHTPTAMSTPLPPSQPESPMESPSRSPFTDGATTVFYQTPPTRSPRPVLYPSPLLTHYQSNSQPHSPHSPLSHSPLLIQHLQQQAMMGQHGQVPPDILPTNLPPALSSLNPRRRMNGTPHGHELHGSHGHGPDTPTPGSHGYGHANGSNSHSQLKQHSHSHSMSTVTSPTPPPPSIQTSVSHCSSRLSPLAPAKDTRGLASGSPRVAQAEVPLSRRENLTSPGALTASGGRLLSSDRRGGADSAGSGSPHTGSSPSPSSSTGYSTSISRSPSPKSPSSHSGHLMSPPVTAIPMKVGMVSLSQQLRVETHADEQVPMERHIDSVEEGEDMGLVGQFAGMKMGGGGTIQRVEEGATKVKAGNGLEAAGRQD